ncbi:MAG: DUF302 domain-containing protein [gamma proteobacterium symbiont of Bathyaustriella thionipta]|nr:DUF302 domain-containing protein [gamma proteobacterium symbiont of Bathyaustriella thionipta]
MLCLEPRIGTVLPCRITVLETDDGVVLISMNPLVIAHLFNNDQLNEFSAQMSETILDVMEESTL